jgi:hypothetical protein
MSTSFNDRSGIENACETPTAFDRLRAEQAATCAQLAQATTAGEDPKPQGWLKKRPKPTPVVK